MAGLDNIKKYQAGEQVEPTGALPAQIQTKAPAGSNIIGTIGVDPEETTKLRDTLQKFIDERTGFMPNLTRGLNAGVAAGYGPEALARFNAQRQAEEKQMLDAYQTIGALNAAQTQAKQDVERLSKILPGGIGSSKTVDGVNLTNEAIMRVSNARNATEALAIIDKDLENQGAARAKGRFEAAGNKSEKFFFNGRWVDMTPNMLANMPSELKQKIEEDTYKLLW